MDFFFHRRFGCRQRRQKQPAAVRPAVQTSKARRRSSVGLQSAALVQARRSSAGLAPISIDQRRRPSVGLLVASGEKRQSIIELGLTKSGEAFGKPEKGAARSDVPMRRGGRRRFHYRLQDNGPSDTVPSRYRGQGMRNRKAQKIKSIEPHLLGSSMLLASVVQMGKEVKEKKEEEDELDISLCSSSESQGEEEGSDEKDGEKAASIIVIKNITTRPLLRPPRCLRRNSSHCLPTDSVVLGSETGYGVYGQYCRKTSSQHPISPSLGQLASADGRTNLGDDDADVECFGSSPPKTCPLPLGGPQGTMYYDPYLESWENFLSYVKHTHPHSANSYTNGGKSYTYYTVIKNANSSTDQLLAFTLVQLLII